MYFKPYSQGFVNVRFPQGTAIYASRPHIRPQCKSQQIPKNVYSGSPHQQHVFLGTKFVMKEQKANNTKDSFREDKQDWVTFPTRYQHVL